MKREIFIYPLILIFLCSCATVYVKSFRYFPNGTPINEVVEKLGQPRYERKIIDDSGVEYVIYRYKIDDLFELYRPTIFYNKSAIQSVPSDFVFKDGLLILEGVQIQGRFFDSSKESEKELLRSINWHLSLKKDDKKLRTSLFW